MKKKPTIPDISEILKMVDDRMKYAIKSPEQAREKAMNEIYENEERINQSLYKDFTTITLGDYIGAAHAFNRETMGTPMDAEQRAAYFTLFAFEERAKRIQEHYTYVQ
tara:strand:- start:256 stop:579 length:324 start_codon:yes stop_codon:yes gene_type:complete